MYISITGFKPKNFISKIKFWMLAIPSWEEALDLWKTNYKEY